MKTRIRTVWTMGSRYGDRNHRPQASRGWGSRMAGPLFALLESLDTSPPVPRFRPQPALTVRFIYNSPFTACLAGRVLCSAMSDVRCRPGRVRRPHFQGLDTPPDLIAHH